LRYFLANALIPCDIPLVLIDILVKILLRGLCPPHFDAQTWLGAMGTAHHLIDFMLWYIAKVNRSWTPLTAPGVPLHFITPLGCRCGLLERFRAEMHGLGGLGLFSQDTCAWEGVYVAKIGRVHTPRFLQRVLLKGWHLSRTPSQRIKGPFRNNLSKMASILAQSAGGHKPSGWARRLQKWFSPNKMRWVDRKNHI
jgi:hypothetical protein